MTTKYTIGLVADALVGCVVQMDGDSYEDAEQKAIQYAKAGNVEWRYRGVYDETIEPGE